MQEKILRIQEEVVPDYGEGYIVTTDKQQIIIAVSDFQDCCECWRLS